MIRCRQRRPKHIVIIDRFVLVSHFYTTSMVCASSSLAYLRRYKVEANKNILRGLNVMTGWINFQSDRIEHQIFNYC